MGERSMRDGRGRLGGLQHRHGLYDGGDHACYPYLIAFNDMTLRHNSHFIMIVRYNTVR